MYKLSELWLWEQQLWFNRFYIQSSTMIYDSTMGKFLNFHEITSPGRTSSYFGVSIKDCLANRYNSFLVHRLLWTLTRGLIPEPLQINHIDGNKHNNEWYNLEIVTSSENNKHAYDTGLNQVSDKSKQASRERLSGSNNPNSKFTPSDIEKIRFAHSTGQSIPSLTTEYNVSYKTMYHIVKNRTYI